MIVTELCRDFDMDPSRIKIDMISPGTALITVAAPIPNDVIREALRDYAPVGIRWIIVTEIQPADPTPTYGPPPTGWLLRMMEWESLLAGAMLP